MPDVFLPVKFNGLSCAFDKGHAVEYGLNEAIMINHLQHRISANEVDGENFHDGRHWTYGRLTDFHLHFPFWSVHQVQRLLASLIKRGILIVGYFNAAWSDRTSWYSFQDYEKFVVTHVKKRQPRRILTPMPSQSKSAHVAELQLDNLQNCNLTTCESATCIIQSSLIREDVREEKIREEREEKKRKEKKTPESGMPNPNAETAGQEKTPESRSPDLGARVADAPLIADAIGTNSVAPLAKSKKRSEFTSKTFEVVQAIITILAANNDAWKPPTNLNSYLDEIQLMLKDSKITSDNIITVMQWAVEEPFWGPILYGQKNVVKYFRSKFAGWSKASNMTGKKPRQFSPCSDDASALKEFTQKHRVIT